jgi:hypothetical protein
MAISEAETLMLSIGDINRMKSEFYEAYQKMFSPSKEEL